jgi:hypothetical protein
MVICITTYTTITTITTITTAVTQSILPEMWLLQPVSLLRIQTALLQPL